MRTVLLTESQLKSLFGENFMSYLENTDTGVEEPNNSYGTEVGLSNKDVDGRQGEQPVTDKIGNVRAFGYPIWGGMGSRTVPMRGLDEANQELRNNGHTYSMGQNMNQDIQNMARNGQGGKMAQNIANEKGMTIDAAYMRLKRLKDMKEQDPQRYQAMQGDRMCAILQNMINTAKKSSASAKKTKAMAGQSNVYQKEGGTKVSGNGMAHSPAAN